MDEAYSGAADLAGDVWCKLSSYGLIPQRLPSMGYQHDPDGMHFWSALGHFYLKWVDDNGQEQTRYYDAVGNRSDGTGDTLAGDFMARASEAVVPAWQGQALSSPTFTGDILSVGYRLVIDGVLQLDEQKNPAAIATRRTVNPREFDRRQAGHIRGSVLDATGSLGVTASLAAGDARLGSTIVLAITTQSLQTVHGSTMSGAGEFHASNQALAHDGRVQIAIDSGAILVSSNSVTSLTVDACMWRNSRLSSVNKHMQIRSMNSKANRAARRYSRATNFEYGMHWHPANEGIWRPGA